MLDFLLLSMQKDYESRLSSLVTIHPRKRLEPFCVVETVDEWVKAIHEVQFSFIEIPHSLCNMRECYVNMKLVLFNR